MCFVSVAHFHTFISRSSLLSESWHVQFFPPLIWSICTHWLDQDFQRIVINSTLMAKPTFDSPARSGWQLDRKNRTVVPLVLEEKSHSLQGWKWEWGDSNTYAGQLLMAQYMSPHHIVFYTIFLSFSFFHFYMISVPLCYFPHMPSPSLYWYRQDVFQHYSNIRPFLGKKPSYKVTVSGRPTACSPGSWLLIPQECGHTRRAYAGCYKGRHLIFWLARRREVRRPNLPRVETPRWEHRLIDGRLKIEMQTAPSFLGYSRLDAEITAQTIDHREQIDLSTDQYVEFLTIVQSHFQTKRSLKSGNYRRSHFFMSLLLR